MSAVAFCACFAGAVNSADDPVGSYCQFHDRNIHPAIRDESTERHFWIQQYVQLDSCVIYAQPFWHTALPQTTT